MELMFIFKASPKKRWWHRFIHPQYQHMMLLTKGIDDPAWMLVDWTAHRLDHIALYPGEMRDFVMDNAEVCVMYLEQDEGVVPKGQIVKFGLLSCVSHAMHAIGHYHWWMMTPWQFKKFITKLGAVDVTGNFRGKKHG